MNFTGQHSCDPNKIDFYNNVNDYIGLIIYSIDKYMTYNSSEEKLDINKETIIINYSLPIIDLSNKKNRNQYLALLVIKKRKIVYIVLVDFVHLIQIKMMIKDYILIH